MGEKKPLGQHPVVEVIGYLDRQTPFPVGSLLLAILCFVYLLNLGAGMFPEIPDIIPGIGNVDEGVAGLLLAWSILNIAQWAKVRRAQRQARAEEIARQQALVVGGEQPLVQAGEGHLEEKAKEQR